MLMVGPATPIARYLNIAFIGLLAPVPHLMPGPKKDAQGQIMDAGDMVIDVTGCPAIYCAGTLRYAATGLHRPWTTQFHRRSLAYTTHTLPDSIQ